jgi:hypothetical protein
MPIFRPNKARGWEYMVNVPRKRRQVVFLWILQQLKELPKEAAMTGHALAVHMPVVIDSIDTVTGRGKVLQTAYVIASDSMVEVGFAKSLRSAQTITGMRLRKLIVPTI